MCTFLQAQPNKIFARVFSSRRKYSKIFINIFVVSEQMACSYIIIEVKGMGGIVFMGALAAFGFLCALWAAAGWLLPGGKQGVAVCFCTPGLGQLSTLQRWYWLHCVGLVRCPILAVDCGLSEAERREVQRLGKVVEICMPEVLADRLELERNQFD